MMLVDGDLVLRLARGEDAVAFWRHHHDPAVHEWWDDNPLSPVAAHRYTRQEPEVCRLAIVYAGEVVGMIQHYHHSNLGRGLDMWIAAECHGQGLGPRAARLVAEHLRAQGYDRIICDPHVDNHAGIRAWERAGFSIVAPYLDNYWLMEFQPPPEILAAFAAWRDNHA